ncbi:hypothetical protein [Methylobacterium persicinum]|uniref:Uncharacterized protein n=1 Tax=Methylobacterium persicinum TaxID=374426 RepID=A0ABU0HHF3_9HYPH|nr:hypothetical protein [Methylobacterium persicinum]MDQ0441754.1 hypothetical protein [Methylobacterium persicinum]GJE39824.1 hypothetical protein KHHGKMAE_3910 [Methylobacterium persicinum]
MDAVTIFHVLQILEERRIHLRLARDRPDTIRVDATLCGLRLEIDCFEDGHIEISTFKGTEDIDGGYDELTKILNHYVME